MVRAVLPVSVRNRSPFDLIIRLRIVGMQPHIVSKLNPLSIDLVFRVNHIQEDGVVSPVCMRGCYQKGKIVRKWAIFKSEWLQPDPKRSLRFRWARHGDVYDVSAANSRN